MKYEADWTKGKEYTIRTRVYSTQWVKHGADQVKGREFMLMTKDLGWRDKRADGWIN